MARPKRDNAAAARLLVDAALLGDRKACERHRTTDRTLRNYRAALKTDAELSALYAEFSGEVATRAWADELDEALAAGIRKMRGLIEATDSPVFLAAVSEAVQGLAKIAITKEVLALDSADEEAEAYPDRASPNQVPLSN